MEIIKTKFEGLKVIKSKIFYDNRGYFREIVKKKILDDKSISTALTSKLDT
jgi:dTDP-4-dehydrorhamnose 3,5-epimerase-like enzyme